MNESYPYGAISVLAQAMSERDLPYLQESALKTLWSLGPQTTDLAYEAAREEYPRSPSLKELLAFDHQDPNSSPDPLLAMPSKQLGGRTVAEYLQSQRQQPSSQDQLSPPPAPETSTPV